MKDTLLAGRSYLPKYTNKLKGQLNLLISPPIEPITRRTYRQAASVLGEAFADEPVSMAVYRNFSHERRAKALTVDFSAELAVALQKGHPIQISQDNEVIAVALIYQPGAYPLPRLDQWMFLIKSVLRNGWYDVRSWMKWQTTADKFHPPNAHYYLEYIGVDPVHQGQGLGSCLIRHMIAQADAEGVSCYLENASPRNLPLYQKFGFKILNEQQIIGFTTWFMWREPS
jgi:ribosomal protein S18 acetylase RimI-like enzyme